MTASQNRATSREAGRLPWPRWPMATPAIEEAAIRVLHSGRWAISGMSSGTESEEKQFGREWARYLDVEFAVPTANGSSAIVACLEAAGIAYGDEVLVPGLAWVACASAVARIGAIPILVDLHAETYAMDASAAESLVTDRTRAVLVTHLSSSIADIDAFQRLCERHDLILIEDCSQAHGAVWRGRRVGSFGEFAAFSFQSSKLLTAGEGGAAVTSGETNFLALQESRADGRVWSSHQRQAAFPDLAAGSELQGHNYCMTEIQAAVLREGLEALDDQNRTRIDRVAFLEDRLATIPGVRTMRRREDSRVDIPTFWHLPIQVDSAEFGGASAEDVRANLSRRVGLFLEPVGAPMSEHPLYRPSLYRRFPSEHVRRLQDAAVALPISRMFSDTCFTLPHHALLADEDTLACFAGRLEALRREFDGNGS